MRSFVPRPLLFDHMPRCGGTAFTGWLRGHYAPDRTLGLEGLGNAERIAGFASLDEHRRHAVELVVGHGARDVIGLVRPDMMRITCFRDPVARVLSFHRYVLQEPKHVHHPFVTAESLGLAAFARDPRVPGARNYYTFQLSRIPREEIARDPRAAVDAAIEFLAREFDIAGTMDRFENFARAVRRAACLYVRDGEARWRAIPRALLDRAHLLAAPKVGIANGAPEGERGPSDDEIEEVRALNRADILFFERIQALEGSLLPAGRCRVV
ncbi:MAG: hypothetical protein LW806_00800 [Planctomycetaceae bacterium]|nr:hypothetical protein [Planctomycetaceae bacterium]